MSDASSPAWPEGIEPIGLEDLRRLGIDSRNQLFWDGRRVEIRSSLKLTSFQKFITAVVTVFAVLGALGGFVTGLNNATVFLCAREIQTLSCPVASPARP